MADGALAGKAVVITGAGRGLGAAFARHAAAAGAQVVVNDLDGAAAQAVADAIVAAGGSASACPANVASWDEAKALIDHCVERFGRIDGLVNNAGIAELGRPEEETEAKIRKHFEVNVYGTYFTSVHAVRHMLDQGSGSIVNVTSGAQSGMPIIAAYGASKGAVASLTYCWATDLKDSGVRVNAIAPQATTGMLDAFARYYASKGQQGGSMANAGLSYAETPPETNAPVVTYLLSDLSATVRGQVVRILGGKTLSLMTHPAAVHPVIDRDSWTVAEVAQAFDDQLAAQQQPLGVATLDVRVVS
jgi:NAD(P)-dependent dehydrogenase (short-subunit alcohol dehydrogenase family)